MAKILVVDDDPQVLNAVERVLLRAGHTVITLGDGNGALDTILLEQPEMIILDIIMPDIDGLEICRQVRANPFTARLPILFLTAKGRPGDVAAGLDVGGDDYLVKPFEVVELPARIRALLRRAAGGSLDVESDEVAVGDLKLSLSTPQVTVGDRTILLTPVEHRLLHALMLRAGHPVPAEILLQEVWGYPPGTGDAGTVRIHIKNLRTKLETHPENPQLILNLHGQGYLIPTAAA